MDHIYLSDLKIEANVGVLDWEKKVRQPLHLDITVFADLKQAGESDDLEQSIDYSELALSMQALADEKHFELIEHFAEVAVARILENALAQEVEIKIHKPYALLNVGRVGVVIRRKQQAG